MNVVGDFFRALPDVFAALWRFVDGWYGVGVLVASIALVSILLLLAKVLRSGHEWLSAIFGGMAITIGMFWGFGILPSAWVYFVDGSRELLEDRIIPSAIPGMDNFYQVFRDTIVVVETGIAITVLVMVALAVQRRYPRTLAEGEEARPQSGGYK